MTLGLHHLAQAAGIRHTVLMPLASGGRMLGYLQAANKRDGTSFDHHDLRFLAIIAGQAAPLLKMLTSYNNPAAEPSAPRHCAGSPV